MTPQELCDIDKKVAEAIGGILGKNQWLFPWGGMARVSTQQTHHPDGLFEEEQENVWKPSTDWNDAMFAAKKARLTGTLVNTPSMGPPFFLCCPDQLKDLGLAPATAETGPLAISLAILSLKGKA